jgi:hypothetical protein
VKATIAAAGEKPDELLQKAIEGYAAAGFWKQAVGAAMQLSPDQRSGWQLGDLITGLGKAGEPALIVTVLKSMKPDDRSADEAINALLASDKVKDVESIAEVLTGYAKTNAQTAIIRYHLKRSNFAAAIELAKANTSDTTGSQLRIAAEALAAAGRIDEAAALAEGQAVQAQQNIYAGIGTALGAKGDFARAAEWLKKAHPSAAYWEWLQIAAARTKAKDLSGQAWAFAAAEDKLPKDAQLGSAAYGYINAYSDAGRWADVGRWIMRIPDPAARYRYETQVLERMLQMEETN